MISFPNQGIYIENQWICFPNSLKIAKILPIYKNGEKTSIQNYRPISLLPVLSKIFEECMRNRLSLYMEKTNILCNEQFGFRQDSNTFHALLMLTDFHYKHIDTKRQTVTIFIDLKKAFDTVNHYIL